MRPGGLKLQLEAAARDDRRRRFAPVWVVPADGDNKFKLVTDSHGRLRYRLTAGDYRLHIEDAPDVPFTVEDRRWTAVRVRLH